MTQKDIDLVKNHLKKLNIAYLGIVGAITVFELILMIRGFAFFNLERLKLRLYLYSYIFLFSASLLTIVTVFLCRNKPKRSNWLVGQTYLYAFCLICWAAFVSTVDSIANGDSGIIVFVMTAIVVGILTLIKPIYFATMLTVSSAGLLVGTYIGREAFFSSGFYINFTVFFVLALFINIHNYKLTKREYEAHIQLEQLSHTDQLTGVYNRRSLDNRVNDYEKRHRKYVFVLVDVDNFKKVNDTFGHDVGDDCLVLIAQKLSTYFGEGIFRFGGDEFAVISSFDMDEVCRTIDRINSELNEAYNDVELHISAGVYQTHNEDTAKEVFIYTDRALYRAKRNGKAQWALYTEE